MKLEQNKINTRRIMTVLMVALRAPWSELRQSRSFVAILGDGKACRPESLLTPERLRS